MRLRSIVAVLVFLVFVLLLAMAEYVAAVKSSRPDTTSATGDAGAPSDGASGADDSRSSPPHDLP